MILMGPTNKGTEVSSSMCKREGRKQRGKDRAHPSGSNERFLPEPLTSSRTFLNSRSPSPATTSLQKESLELVQVLREVEEDGGGRGRGGGGGVESSSLRGR